MKGIQMKAKRSETDLTTWSTRELKKRVVGLYSATQTEGCPAHDLLELEAVKAELTQRGYVFEKSLSIKIA
jgi:hypothetical protein